MSDLFVFDNLLEEGVLLTYPVGTGRAKRGPYSKMLMGERVRERKLVHAAANILARAWRCHCARADFEAPTFQTSVLLYILYSCKKCSWALTFENLCATATFKKQ